LRPTVLLCWLPRCCCARAWPRLRIATSEDQALSEEAERRWEQGTLEHATRRSRRLEQAAHLAPRETAVLAQLARAYLDAGFSHDARRRYEHITALAPNGADAVGWARPGVWKRDWLATLATASARKDHSLFDEGGALRSRARRGVDAARGVAARNAATRPSPRAPRIGRSRPAPDSVGPLHAAGILGYQTGTAGAGGEPLHAGDRAHAAGDRAPLPRPGAAHGPARTVTRSRN
jgi:hypothetical protein